MKKILFTIIAIVAKVLAKAEDYPFLTFQTPGKATSVEIGDKLVLTLGSDGTLTVGTHTLTLTDLSQMYFTQTPIELVTVSEVGWATHCSANALDYVAAEGLTVYATAIDETSGSVTPTAVTTAVEAGTGVLLSGGEGSYRVPVVASGEALAGNSLSGTIEALPTTSDYKYYALCKMDDTKVGFRQVQTGIDIPAGKAYYRTAVSNSREYYVIGEGITAIRLSDSSVDSSEPCYDLQGRRVDHPRRGIYIRGGKRVIVK